MTDLRSTYLPALHFVFHSPHLVKSLHPDSMDFMKVVHFGSDTIELEIDVLMFLGQLVVLVVGVDHGLPVPP